jgi:murein biosynthesis integral membrane protein MurJ
MVPLIIGIVFSQLSTIVDNMFASTLATGSVSALAYSKKLVEMPVVVLPYAIGIVIFPFFAELAISKEREKLIEMLMHAVKILAFIFIPAAVGLIILRDPVVSIIFKRGAFDAHSAELTSSALFYYALGLFTFAVEVILVQFYFSMSDTRTPIAVGIGCVLLNILVTVILIRFMAHCGIALALTISKTIKVIILYGLLKRKLPEIRLSQPTIFFVKLGAASIVMGLCVGYVSGRLPFMDSQSVSGQAAGLLISVLSGCIIFIAVLFILRLGELRSYWDYMRVNVLRVGRS